MNVDCDVIVIGAGLSGLTAAYHLKKRHADLNIIVVEASARIGGRLFSRQVEVTGGRKAVFDFGGQWIGSSQGDILALIKDLDTSDLLYPQYLEGESLSWIKPWSAEKFIAKSSRYSHPLFTAGCSFLKTLDDWASRLNADNPFLNSPVLADFLDSITLEDLLRQHVYNSETREMFRAGIRRVFGFEATQISALYAVLYGKASGRLSDLLLTCRDSALKWRFAGGADVLTKRLAEYVGDKNIILSAPVTTIEQNDDFIVVTCAFSDSDSVARLTAYRVILAIPPPQILKLDILPRLPTPRIHVLRALPMANLIKFVATYSNAFWREKNLSGEIISYGGSTDDRCPVGPLCYVYDLSLPDGTAALGGYLSGNQSVYWSRRPFVERKRAVLFNIAKMLGKEAWNPVDFQEMNWALDKWTGGCPVACLQPGLGRFFTSSMRLPIGRIHLAGTETAQRSIGYMSGAVQAGRRAAVEVLYSLGKHSSADDSILESTCYGSAGQASMLTVKWPTISSPNWIFRCGTLIGLGFLIYRLIYHGPLFTRDGLKNTWLSILSKTKIA